MRSFKQFSLILFSIGFLFNCQSLSAQNGSDYLKVGANAIFISNLRFTDSIAGQRKIFVASFEISLTDGKECLAIVDALQFAGAAKKPGDIAISTCNTNYEIEEERIYKDPIVTDIRFPGVIGTGRESVKLNVTIQSTSLVFNKLVIGQKGSIQTAAKGKVVLQNNCMVTIGNLPARHVAYVSEFQLSDNSQMFSLEVPLTEKKAWYDWFESSKGAQPLQGNIALLDPAMMHTLLTLTLSDIEIVSFSYDGRGTDRIRRAVVRMRVRSVTLNK